MTKIALDREMNEEAISSCQGADYLFREKNVRAVRNAGSKAGKNL